MNPLVRNRNLQAVSRTRSAVRRAVLVFAVLAAVLLSAAPLRADQDINSTQVVYNGSAAGQPFCVTNHSELYVIEGPISPGFYQYNWVATTTGCPGACRVTPAGNLKIQQILYRWVPFWIMGFWMPCRTGATIYNDSAQASLYSFVQTGSIWGFGFWSPCGAGYYKLVSMGYAWDGSAWQGGPVSSGTIYMSH